MAKTPDFQHPVSWAQLLEPFTELFPPEKREAVLHLASALHQRDLALEDFLSFKLELITWEFDGPVLAAVSNPVPVQRGGRVQRIDITASVEASTDTTFALYVDGVQIGANFVLPAGEGATPYSVDVTDFRYDFVNARTGLTVEAVTVGTGLEGAVVTVGLEG